MPASYRQVVVLCSSRFQHILSDEGSTNWAYAGDPLSRITHAQRGLMFEGLARQMLERAHPNHLCEDAYEESSGTCVGALASRGPVAQAPFDCMFMGRRLELKTSQLCYETRPMTWRVKFLAVKLARDGLRASQPFDDLYLLIFAPDGFYLIKHDLQTGVSKEGVRTESKGHVIQILGRRGQTWKESLQTILGRLTSQGCELVSYASKSDPLASALYAELSQKASDPAQQAFEGIPLSTMNPILRAHRIQQIAYELDKMQHSCSAFESATGEISSLGCRRGNGNAAVDWVRDGVRIEVKSARLSFYNGLWRCIFSNIKEGVTYDGKNLYFDELWLAIYSPYGLDFFTHPNWKARLQRIGKPTAALGKKLEVTGGRQNPCPFTALAHIKAKLQENGANWQFTVKWATETS